MPTQPPMSDSLSFPIGHRQYLEGYGTPEQRVNFELEAVYVAARLCQKLSEHRPLQQPPFLGEDGQLLLFSLEWLRRYQLFTEPLETAIGEDATEQRSINWRRALRVALQRFIERLEKTAN